MKDTAFFGILFICFGRGEVKKRTMITIQMIYLYSQYSSSCPSAVFGGLIVPCNETICSCEEITPLNTLEYILKIKLSRGYGQLRGGKGNTRMRTV